MIKRINEDTIVVTTEKIIKISDLEDKKKELEAIDVSAKEHNAWVRSLPSERSVPEMPETENEIAELQKEIDLYKNTKINDEVIEKVEFK